MHVTSQQGSSNIFVEICLPFEISKSLKTFETSTKQYLISNECFYMVIPREHLFLKSYGISHSHEGHNPPFWGYCMSVLVKDSGQFKQREKRLLKVVTVKLPLYKQLQY
jgi:hypothetical protein